MADDEKKDEIVTGSDQGDDDDDDGGGGTPAWMSTFADMVTLLLCFFVLLFAMSTTQQETFKELVRSLRSALGVQQIPEAGTREGLVMRRPPSDQKPQSEAVDELGGMVQQEVEEIVSEVRELVMFNKLAGQVKVQENEIGAVITISDMILFAPGNTKMSEDGLELMAKVGKVLKQFAYHVTIAGHTDDRPIHSRFFPSNWELSVNRAASIVRFLIDKGINPKLISAEGFAQFKPIATNDTEEGRSKNRRVEIIYERDDIARELAKRELR